MSDKFRISNTQQKKMQKFWAEPEIVEIDTLRQKKKKNYTQAKKNIEKLQEKKNEIIKKIQKTKPFFLRWDCVGKISKYFSRHTAYPLNKMNLNWFLSIQKSKLF